MGSFYGNVTLVGTDLDQVVPHVAGPALGFADGDCVVVFAAEDDEGGPQSGGRMSAALGCTAFSVGVHDDDILFFEVHRAGELVLTGAVPDPAEVFDAGEPGPRVDPDALIAAVGRGDPQRVRTALEVDVVFATDRHVSLCEALGLPTSAAGWGYRYLEREADAYDGPVLTTLA